jgi:hypothetical protein
MKAKFLQVRSSGFLALTTALSFVISAPALWAQDGHPGRRPGEHPHGYVFTNSMSAPLKEAWATVKQSVKEMDTAVQSRNLHGVHVATVKINPAITTLQDHSNMFREDKAQKLLTTLRRLRHCVLRLHRAGLDNDQTKAEEELPNVDSAFRQVEAEDPENTLKDH